MIRYSEVARATRARSSRPSHVMTEGGQKSYLGMSGWDRRVLWFLNTPEASEPHQWRTADGANRCVRCGYRVGNAGRLCHGTMMACVSCAKEVEYVGRSR